jgi:hypothetical protein
MRKSLQAALFAIPVAAALLLTGSGPAAAAPPGCPAGALCVYRDINYAWGPYKFFGTNYSWHQWAIADRDSSWFNNGTSGRSARVWEHVGYSGRVEVCIARGHGIRNQWWFDDLGSSNDWPSRC